MRLFLVLAALLAAGNSSAAPLDIVRQCASTAPLNVVGLKDLEPHCPGLTVAMADLGLADMLFASGQQKLNAATLHDLVRLADDYALPAAHAPDPHALAAILASLTPAVSSAPQSWWQSVKAWLKQWLQHSDSAIANWLRHALDRWLAQANVSQSALQLIAYCLMALMALGAVTVVIRELMAARIGWRKRTARAGGPSRVTEALDILAVADRRDRLTELLRALVEQLQRSGRLNAQRSLTHRELIGRSRFENAAQRETFAAVAAGAERLYYGPGGPESVTLDETARRGAALLEQLTESNPAA